jgi:serine/threonine protein kinase
MDDFELIATLGSGAFGVVYKVLDKSNNEVMVVKKIPFVTIKDVYNISSEIQILRKLSHPYIIQ